MSSGHDKEKLDPFYIPISHEEETGDEAYVSSMRSVDTFTGY